MVNNRLKNSAASYRVPLWKREARQESKLSVLYGAPDFLLNFLPVLICLQSPKRCDFVHKQMMSSQVRTTIQLFGGPSAKIFFSKRQALKKKSIVILRSINYRILYLFFFRPVAWVQHYSGSCYGRVGCVYRVMINSNSWKTNMALSFKYKVG